MLAAASQQWRHLPLQPLQPIVIGMVIANQHMPGPGANWGTPCFRPLFEGIVAGSIPDVIWVDLAALARRYDLDSQLALLTLPVP
jgi:hypothetical protein